MNKLFNKQAAGGFTLIELLVVMGIIGILAALLFPAISAAFVKAQKTQARTEVRAMSAAVQAFYNEYGRMPGGTETFGDSKAIAKVLTGNDVTLNARNLIFLEAQEGSADGTFLDPWEVQYEIQVDANYDGRISYSNKNYTVAAIARSKGPPNNPDEIVSCK